MNARSRNALAMLQKYPDNGTVQNKSTRVDGRGKGARVKINHTTAYALEAQGFVEIDDSAKPFKIKLTEAGKSHTFD